MEIIEGATAAAILVRIFWLIRGEGAAQDRRILTHFALVGLCAVGWLLDRRLTLVSTAVEYSTAPDIRTSVLMPTVYYYSAYIFGRSQIVPVHVYTYIQISLCLQNTNTSEESSGYS